MKIRFLLAIVSLLNFATVCNKKKDPMHSDSTSTLAQGKVGNHTEKSIPNLKISGSHINEVNCLVRTTTDNSLDIPKVYPLYCLIFQIADDDREGKGGMRTGQLHILRFCVREGPSSNDRE